MTDETQTPSDSKLEELVTRCLERVEREGDPRIDDVCRDDPALKEAVARRFAMLKSIGLLSETPSAAAAPRAVDDFPEMLGDFRLLHRIGGGGMGVVYLARQETLGREVALKLIRPEYLYFEGAKVRFRREVETIASLNHPGIVPIYTVGEEKGIPYYAMEHVEGSSLSDVLESLHGRDVTLLTATDFAKAIQGLDERQATALGERLGPSWIQACLRVMLQAAQALSHAHGRGVVHRDIKPGNILIRRDGTAMLVDFGLASQRGSSKLTQTGTALGSPQYMAPEIWTGGGNIADARSDVYSLGVTLYEMLSLAPPHAGGSDELFRRVLEGDFDPLRKNNPLVPWDVETVCQKAMERDRRRRYEAAADFADDLKNLLELRPITAARPTPLLRARRFAQRRPGSAMAVVLAFFLVVVFPLAYSAVLHVKNREIENEKLEADRQRATAIAHRNATLGALDVMVGSFSDPSLDGVPGIEGLRRHAMEQVDSVVKLLTGATASDPDIARRMLYVRSQVAKLTASLGDYAAALEQLEQVIAETEKTFGQEPHDSAMRILLAKAYLSKAHAQRALGRNDECAVNFARSIDDFERIIADAPDSLLAHQMLCEALGSLAALNHEFARFDAAESAARRLESVLDVAQRRWPSDKALEEYWIKAHAEDALRAAMRGDSSTAKAQLDVVTKRLEGSRLGDPEAFESAQLMAIVRSNLAEVAKTLRDFEGCERWLGGAIRGIRMLVARFPERPEYRVLLARCLGQAAENRNFLTYRSDAEVDAGRKRSLDEYKESVDVMHALKSEHFSSIALDTELGSILGSYGDWLQNAKDFDGAMTMYRESEKLLRDRLASSPDNPADRTNLAVDWTELGRCLGLMDRRDESLDLTEKAWKIFEENRDRHWITDADFIDHGSRNRLVLADFFIDRHDHGKALNALADLSSIAASPQTRFDCIRKLEFCIDDALADASLQDADRARAAEAAAQLAVRQLDAILAAGVTTAGAESIERVRSDDFYAALRATAAYREFAAKHP